ncbi:MAG: alkyl sulfatase dimerization domain-containing protein [Parvularculaceae bacterium]|nr:alkyl sulfatase dimerization domain-containing protein [Parvularculaceae bacterium]
MKAIAIAAVLAVAPIAAHASPASEATRTANASAGAALPAENEDADFADRGFVATSDLMQIKSESGAVVWDFSAYGFLDGDAPASVNPSLWRHAKLLTKHGLFKAHDRLYQVRGFDISNMSIILGDKGLILVDPLASVEAARAALKLARAHLGDKPVVAVIYTHSHIDHFGGVKGVISADDVAKGRVKIIAPAGFLEHAVTENVIAGNAMSRRAVYQFGAALTAGPEGSVTSGIGPRVSGGARSIIAPTTEVTRTGERHVIDGVEFVFQLTPETEAPSEMNFFLPQFGALCLAENANPSIHNVLTPRGALVRDAKRWADYLTEAQTLYGERSEILFTSHGWPRFGRAAVNDFIANHRDAYKYLHDQTVRLMNMGLTGEEIADRLELPPSLAKHWFNRGYYGTMRHNSRAVYQRYMGWYDGNPSSLDSLPKEETAARTVALMGGAKKVRKAAQKAMAAGDYRWAAELLDIGVFAGDAAAKPMLAEAHRQMAYQAESAIWRNMYLMAARELTEGVAPSPPVGQSLDFIAATPTAALLDLLAVRLDPEKARDMKLNLSFPDRKEVFLVTVRNGVLVHQAGATSADAAVSLTLPRAGFLGAMFAGFPASPKIDGDAGAWSAFRAFFETPDPNFAIVTP